MQPTRIDEERFQVLLQTKLGKSWERALKVFREYGVRLSWDVANILLHASGLGKVDETLAILEQHYAEHLQFQHPDIRGTVTDALGVNTTQAMFLQLCQETLGLQPRMT